MAPIPRRERAREELQHRLAALGAYIVFGGDAEPEFELIERVLDELDELGVPRKHFGGGQAG